MLTFWVLACGQFEGKHNMVAIGRSEDEAWGRRKLVGVPFLPPNLKMQSKEEKNYLKLHKCVNAGEVYSASYLITREHLIYQHTAYNLTWVNCEMGLASSSHHPQCKHNDDISQVIHHDESTSEP